MLVYFLFFDFLFFGCGFFVPLLECTFFPFLVPRWILSFKKKWIKSSILSKTYEPPFKVVVEANNLLFRSDFC
jgi:hypothetical protein